MTDYQVYGARHFLRSADPEAASELRRRYDYLTNGQVLPPKTPWADIDRFRLDGILDYRTLVLRRGPLSSRPPSVYRLVRSGRYYEVWQRPAQVPSTIVEHLGLDTSSQPGRVPACSEVMRLAKEAGVASLAAATRPQTIWLGAPPLSGSATSPSRSRATASTSPGSAATGTATPRSRSTGTRSAPGERS